MKEIFSFSVLFFLLHLTTAQENCNVFLWAGDTAKYNACTYVQNAPSYFQLTLKHHKIRDSAIQIAPHYDYPYWSKSIAFLKTGDFLGWKKMIDQAVGLNELKHLGYRGWCRFQFFRDYKGAIKDLERLEAIMGTTDTGVSQNGVYHLQVAKALCYKMVGEKDRAIKLIETQIAADPDYIGVYDYLHLGILYFETGDLHKAQSAFTEQEKIAELAENSFYRSKISTMNGKESQAVEYADEALERYDAGKFNYDPYSHPIDQVYRSQILELIGEL